MGPEGSSLKISELGQDFFALECNYYGKNKFFVDIGAADGITASNTFLLEKFYKWKGICVDPNPVFFQSLFNSRDCHASTLCVYDKTGQILPFKFCNNEHEFFGWNFKSSILDHFNLPNKDIEKNFKEINVLTISLKDLLKLYCAPKVINYVSIDTEGSEYEIIKNFDFNEYDIRSLTIECLNVDKKHKIRKILVDNGYILYNKCFTGDEDWFYRN